MLTTTTTGDISANVPSDAVVLYRVTALAGLSVGISSPANAAVVGANPTTVTGTAIALGGVRSVIVNGVDKVRPGATAKAVPGQLPPSPASDAAASAPAGAQPASGAAAASAASGA